MKYKNANDKELWERCQQGDEMAFAELFERYFQSVLWGATRSIKDKNEAEELVMDAFLSLWTRRENIIDGNFLNYLLGSVYKLIASNLRKTALKTVDLESVENIHSIDCSADSGLLLEEIKESYYKALEKLSPRRKEAFLLSRSEDLSYAEIASKMNISINVVEHYMSVALGGLRENLKGYLSVLLLFLFSTF